MDDIDLVRVRFVAGRYRELQGLRTVVDVVTFFGVWCLLAISPADRSAVPYIGALFTVPPCLALYGLRVAWRDWPHRSQWLLVALVGIAFGLAFPGGRSPHLDAWQWGFVRTAVPVLILAGVLDHHLLVRVMRRAPHTTSDTKHADAI